VHIVGNLYYTILMKLDIAQFYKELVKPLQFIRVVTPDSLVDHAILKSALLETLIAVMCNVPT
jgi:hypothetical protein